MADKASTLGMVRKETAGYAFSGARLGASDSWALGPHALWPDRCLAVPAPSADRAVNALYIATDIPRHDAPFGRPISDKNAQAHGLHEPLFRKAGRLPFLSRPKKGVATLCRR